MAASSNKKAELEALFEKLDSQVQAGQLKKASKTVEQVLQLDNVHPTALHMKGALLAQTGKHEDLLKFLEKPSGQRVVQELAFEKAYCLYRLGRFQEALEALQQVGEDKVQGKLHLQAQLNHRLGHSKESISAYQELSTKHADQSLELQTNVLAAYVENGRSQEIPQVMEAMKISADKSYEIAFNQACGLIATGELAEAEQHLLLALRKGQETLYSEDFTDAEVNEEMGPVNAQLAYVLRSLGR
ncbi:signal recognition particle subunit SRP72-like, partial [Convolutriloba macropyga]|uniref:signal recognition particle subunit SRP72-like n=1 Tax=Convolutriloba macropyga TaxID=536237 RepID=UPI003F51B877